MICKVFNRWSLSFSADSENNEKTRQTTENKQTLDLGGKMKLREKLVKTLKINKLFVLS